MTGPKLTHYEKALTEFLKTLPPEYRNDRAILLFDGTLAAAIANFRDAAAEFGQALRDAATPGKEDQRHE